MRKLVRLAPAVLACAFLLASCGPPQSESPLCDPSQASADESLLGVWRVSIEKENRPAYFHFVAAPGNRIDIVIVAAEEGGAEVDAYEGFVTRLGSARYLNVKHKAPGAKEADGHYFIARYEVKGDLGRIDLPDEDVVKASIEGGKVAGRAEADEVRLTDTPENLRRFVGAAGDALWKKFVDMRRVAGPGN
jgi:hypothetical protein